MGSGKVERPNLTAPPGYWPVTRRPRRFAEGRPVGSRAVRQQGLWVAPACAAVVCSVVSVEHGGVPSLTLIALVAAFTAGVLFQRYR
jgi:hypothetical protein